VLGHSVLLNDVYYAAEIEEVSNVYTLSARCCQRSITFVKSYGIKVFHISSHLFAKTALHSRSYIFCMWVYLTAAVNACIRF